MRENHKARLFVLLFVAGFVGVLSFLLVDLSTVLSLLPETQGTELPFSLWTLKIISLIQPTVLVAIAVLVGVLLAQKVKLSAPAFEALARRESFVAALKPQILPGVIAGLIGAIAITVIWIILKPFLPAEFVTRALAFNRVMPIATRILYGGFTEEILLRWGLLTLLVWVPWRIIQRGRSEPAAACFVGAILISSIVFGMGHLPVAAILGGGLSAPIVTYVILANSVFGLLAGFLYWRKGLEAAIIAHMFAHVCLVFVIYFLI